MPKPSRTHAYSDQSAFERLLLLIATVGRYPGIGSGNDDVNAAPVEPLGELQAKILEVAQELGFAVKEYSLPTLRKDLALLRRYGVLTKSVYRWGYFLGFGAVGPAELPMIMEALLSMATYQNSHSAKRVYDLVQKRLKGLLGDAPAYLTRAFAQNCIVDTDTDAMISQQRHSHNLFFSLEQLEQAMLNGQAVEIYQTRNLYGKELRQMVLFPLQLLYHEVAWYLIGESCLSESLAEPKNPHWVVLRVDRFSDQINLISKFRSQSAQRQSLARAEQLLRNGWGLYLGDADQQAAELAGQIDLIKIVVRFFDPVTKFIQEGNARHIRQKIYDHSKSGYLDYEITLPPRSKREFYRWTRRFSSAVMFLEPEELIQKHQQEALELTNRYNSHCQPQE
ncbi:MAG: helix-turn-helix transcriptional regulator [Pseudanabaenaceae cyanobacterium]